MKSKKITTNSKQAAIKFSNWDAVEGNSRPAISFFENICCTELYTTSADYLCFSFFLVLSIPAHYPISQS